MGGTLINDPGQLQNIQCDSEIFFGCDKMIGSQNESAVSETIAITLIVALTVVLAAIVAVYALGMATTIPTSRNIALSVGQVDADTVTLVYHGGPDADSLVTLNITWPSGTPQTVNGPKIGDTFSAINPPAGVANITSGRDRIIIVGYFTNNVQQVVLDTFV